MPFIRRKLVSILQTVFFMASLGALPAHALVLAGSAEFSVSYFGDIYAEPGVPIPATPLLGSGAFSFVGEDVLEFGFEFLGETFNEAGFWCDGCDPVDEEGSLNLYFEYDAGFLAWSFDDGACGFLFDIRGLSGFGACEDYNVDMSFSSIDFRLVPEPNGLATLGLLLLLLASAPVRTGHCHR